jgi:hypothetical protein
MTLAAGCGHTQTVGAGRTLQLGLTEYHLNPQSARASAGLLTIVVHNYGRLTHNLVISLDGRAQGSTQPIPPGQSAELVVDLFKGRYTIASTIMSDQALGASGTLTVS